MKISDSQLIDGEIMQLHEPGVLISIVYLKFLTECISRECKSMVAYDLTSTIGDDYEYAKRYGESELMPEFLEYERITGEDWLDSFIAFCKGNPQREPQHSIECFHKEIVIKGPGYALDAN